MTRRQPFNWVPATFRDKAAFNFGAISAGQAHQKLPSIAKDQAIATLLQKVVYIMKARTMPVPTLFESLYFVWVQQKEGDDQAIPWPCLFFDSKKTMYACLERYKMVNSPKIRLRLECNLVSSFIRKGEGDRPVAFLLGSKVPDPKGRKAIYYDEEPLDFMANLQAFINKYNDNADFRAAMEKATSILDIGSKELEDADADEPCIPGSGSDSENEDQDDKDERRDGDSEEKKHFEGLQEGSGRKHSGSVQQQEISVPPPLDKSTAAAAISSRSTVPCQDSREKNSSSSKAAPAHEDVASKNAPPPSANAAVQGESAQKQKKPANPKLSQAVKEPAALTPSQQREATASVGTTSGKETAQQDERAGDTDPAVTVKPDAKTVSPGGASSITGMGLTRPAKNQLAPSAAEDDTSTQEFASAKQSPADDSCDDLTFLTCNSREAASVGPTEANRSSNKSATDVGRASREKQGDPIDLQEAKPEKGKGKRASTSKKARQTMNSALDATIANQMQNPSLRTPAKRRGGKAKGSKRPSSATSKGSQNGSQQKKARGSPSPSNEKIRIPKFEDVKGILEKAGYVFRDGYYCRPPSGLGTEIIDGKDRFTNEKLFRDHLCEFGVDGDRAEWTDDEEDIVRQWVRYAIVNVNFQTRKFFPPRDRLNTTQAWGLLQKLGFSFNGTYRLPGGCSTSRRTVLTDFNGDGTCFHFVSPKLKFRCCFD